MESVKPVLPAISLPGEARAQAGASTRRRWLWPTVALVAWAVVLAFGFNVLWQYKSTPGEPGRPPSRWPTGSRIVLDGGHPTLLMFVHPRCPCTNASISELGRLMARVGQQVRAQVVVLRPGDVGPDWDQAALWGRAAAIDGVTVVRDEDGAEAERFNAFTSGMVVLYGTDGRRLFNGGITASRGHEGESFGRRRILALLSGQTPDRDQSPVFGCALRTAPEAGGHVHHEGGV